MPKCFTVFGYVVFFWSNENDPLEPIHVHVAKRIGKNATKIWLLSDGSAELANNHSRIPAKDLKRIMAVIEMYAPDIVAKWEKYFDVTAAFKDQA